jgi:hypothetical protein
VSDAPVRRRRLAQEAPGTPPSIKRKWWYGGAILGTLVGAVVAVLAIPPVFDRYFGIADIALGHTYDGQQVDLRVEESRRSADGGRIEVVLAVSENTGWCPAASAFRLEFAGNVSLGGARLDPDPGDCGGGVFARDALTLSFEGRNRELDDLHILHIDDPKVRLWLQPGEPGE